MTIGLLLGLASWSAAVQGPIPERIVQWTARAQDDRPGVLVVSAQIQEGWYIYSLTQPAGGPIPLRISMETSGFELRSLRALDRPAVAHDPNFDISTEKHRAVARFEIEYSARTAPGRRRVRLSARYQACSGEVCLPPQTASVEAVVLIPDKPLAAREGDSPVTITTSLQKTGELAYSAVTGDAGQSWTSMSWLGVAGGILSVLTPCVFPLLPVTAGIGRGSRGRTRLAPK